MKPRIIVTSNYINNGLAFIRGHQFFRELKDKYEFHSHSTCDLREDNWLYADAVVMLHPETEEQLTLVQRITDRFSIPVIVDVDDYMDGVMSENPVYTRVRRNMSSATVKKASAVTTSTKYLKGYLSNFNRNVSLIENCIDANRYPTIEQRVIPMHKDFIIGWTGSQSHMSDFVNTGFLEGLQMFMREKPDTRFFAHMLCPQSLIDEFGVRVQFVPEAAHYADWPQVVATYPFDVCANPLYKHPFNEAKSDLKMLDLAPYAIPLLVSSRASFVEPDLADKVLLVPDDCAQSWHERLNFCYENRDLISQVGSRAKEYALKCRTILQGAARWDRVLSNALYPSVLESIVTVHPTRDPEQTKTPRTEGLRESGTRLTPSQPSSLQFAPR